MSRLRLSGGAAAAVIAGLLAASSIAHADGTTTPNASPVAVKGTVIGEVVATSATVKATPAKSSTPAATASSLLSKQTPMSTPAPAQSSAAVTTAANAGQPVNMGIDAFRSECSTPQTVQDAVLQPLPNRVEEATGPEKGAKFMPLFKMGERADDPSNKGNFIDKHEFGVQLISHF